MFVTRKPFGLLLAALLLITSAPARVRLAAEEPSAGTGRLIIGTFPEHTHPPIVYPIALTANATHPDAAVLLARRNHSPLAQARIRLPSATSTTTAGRT